MSDEKTFYGDTLQNSLRAKDNPTFSERIPSNNQGLFNLGSCGLLTVFGKETEDHKGDRQ